MPVLAGIAAVAGPLIGGVVGNITSSADRNAATQAALSAYSQIQAIGAPPDMAQALLLQSFQNAGVLTPEMEQAVKQTYSAQANVQGNQAAQTAQLQALGQLQQLGQTGMTPQARAAAMQLQAQAQAAASSRQQAILQQMQARGLGSSGATLAEQLSNAQNAANQQSQANVGIGANAAQQALQALSQSGGLASNIEQQQFGEASSRAQAQDQMNRFNIANQMSAQQANVQAQNQAQQFNLLNSQDIQNRNIQQYNAEQARQLAGQQQNFQNQLALQNAKANSLLGQSTVYQNLANQQATQLSGIGAGVGAGAGALFNATNTSPQNQYYQNLVNAQNVNTNQAGLQTIPGAVTQSQQTMANFPQPSDVNLNIE